MKKILTLAISILIFSNSLVCVGQIYNEKSKFGNYPINLNISLKYKTEVFGDPFGRFLEDSEGWMKNEKGVRGEYEYLGFNYEEDPITNDRYFSKLNKRGNVFDENYSNVEWQEIPEV